MRLFGQGRIAIALSGVTVLAGAYASSAAASVTIGQLAPGPIPSGNCGANAQIAQQSVASGLSYVVPPGGAKITSWSTQANDQPNQGMKLKVYRPIAGLSFQVVGHDGPFPLTPLQVNTFVSDVSVQPGDVLGFTTGAAASSMACIFAGSGSQSLVNTGDTADGSSVTFSPLNNALANISAQVGMQASNDITLGKLKRNKKKGTATLAVDVPGPGALTLTGTGVKAQRPGTATASKTASAAGTVKLRIKAKGAKKAKLRDRGKVKVKVNVAFAPSGSDVPVAPGTDTKRVKLIEQG